MAESTGARLDRIENKLDQLTEAMVAMARAEEKLQSLKEDHDRSFERMNRFSKKLDEIEKKVDDNARVVQAIQKLFWIMATVVIGAAVKMMML